MAQALYKGLTPSGTNILTDRPSVGLTGEVVREREPTALPTAGDVYSEQMQEYQHAQTQKRYFTDWAIKRGASRADIEEAVALKGWDAAQRPQLPAEDFKAAQIREKEAKTVTTDKGMFQWNPESQRYDIKVGDVTKAGRGGVGDKAGKTKRAAEKVSVQLKEMKGLYTVLKKMGAIVDTEKGPLDNLMAAVGASGPGQFVSKITGSKAQSIRNRVLNLQPLLINNIRQASEMGARGMDSEKELEFYLRAATNPKVDVQSNFAALKVLELAYGSGTEGQPKITPGDAKRLFIESGGDEALAEEMFTPDDELRGELSGIVKTDVAGVGGGGNLITVPNPTTGEDETWDTVKGVRIK
jgi:hypothetical protein